MKILEKFNIETNNDEIYIQALTHTSYANETRTTSYERLEYLGDSVIDLIVSTYLYRCFDYQEGDMTKLRASLVCEEALYEYAKNIGLIEFIRLGKGEIKNNGFNNKTIIADVFEAFTAAIYLDQGYEYTVSFFEERIIPLIKKRGISFDTDYKSNLQEAVQTGKNSLEYKLIKEIGPSHDKKFVVDVIIDGITYGRGIAASKKEAEKQAAKEALEKAKK